MGVTPRGFSPERSVTMLSIVSNLLVGALPPPAILRSGVYRQFQSGGWLGGAANGAETNAIQRAG